MTNGKEIWLAVRENGEGVVNESQLWLSIRNGWFIGWLVEQVRWMDQNMQDLRLSFPMGKSADVSKLERVLSKQVLIASVWRWWRQRRNECKVIRCVGMRLRKFWKKTVSWIDFRYTAEWAGRLGNRWSEQRVWMRQIPPKVCFVNDGGIWAICFGYNVIQRMIWASWSWKGKYLLGDQLDSNRDCKQVKYIYKQV